MAASKVSKLGRVRKELVKRQQKMAEAKGFIMDGRDIGTVVLPHAEVKIFMTASPEARAKRRYDQDQLKGIESGSLEQIASEIRARDEQDMNRKESPLRKADDAVLLDTSNMSIDEVADAVVKMAQERIGEQA
jgi:cytidylate kinase